MDFSCVTEGHRDTVECFVLGARVFPPFPKLKSPLSAGLPKGHPSLNQKKKESKNSRVDDGERTSRL